MTRQFVNAWDSERAPDAPSLLPDTFRLVRIWFSELKPTASTATARERGRPQGARGSESNGALQGGQAVMDDEQSTIIDVKEAMPGVTDRVREGRPRTNCDDEILTPMVRDFVNVGVVVLADGRAVIRCLAA